MESATPAIAWYDSAGGESTRSLCRGGGPSLSESRRRIKPTEEQLDDKTAYLEWIKSWTEEDKKVVLLLIAFDLGTISLILSGKTGAGSPMPTLRGLGLVCLLVSAGS